MAGKKRQFGRVRKLPSGRYQARYLGPDGIDRPAPRTFRTKKDADDWLADRQSEVRSGDWRDPDAGAVNFREYALRWVEERGLAATTDELYRRLLRLHILPTFRDIDLDKITPSGVRTWRTERLKATEAPTTVAKSYRLLKAIMETAVDDELIRRNPCRIKGAGKESAEERPTATVAQVDALADAMGPRWRLMVYIAAYGPARPEEQAAMRWPDVDLENVGVWIRTAEPELTTGRRAPGDTKSAAGRRFRVLPPFMAVDLKRHLDWYAEKDPNGLLFVGERGKPFRRSTFGRKWRKARTEVGLPDNFRFYDLRHTGHTLSTRSGATLKDTMVRAGQSSEKAAMKYQHSDTERQKEVADGIDAHVQAERLRTLAERDESRSGTQRARNA
ncbi:MULTISPECIES: tyrosine-type recombinase/integrase [unclassified Streptomyces]|uniref:tyrosine-type recombinase/integrase n=1 Tax=unclassified Streptomyces TaxID=2593676 RepID=UPI00225AF7AD|nr:MULTISPECIES: tyrosine-type recombinase/integrase [unclassified Streptomyces]MCX4796481.1 site-specific integrase [Streptomyces sp. NBC_01242]WSJ37711.1 site-specific integrase [Streptomyces sp. NBC_01321]WSP64109.1 site-specific integrase [Streptomyces sp. NBC_01240]WSU23235.1 site-specific integrase [Streptomyces sp. NBC_01108]